MTNDGDPLGATDAAGNPQAAAPPGPPAPPAPPVPPPAVTIAQQLETLAAQANVAEPGWSESAWFVVAPTPRRLTVVLDRAAKPEDFAPGRFVQALDGMMAPLPGPKALAPGCQPLILLDLTPPEAPGVAYLASVANMGVVNQDGANALKAFKDLYVVQPNGRGSFAFVAKTRPLPAAA